MKNILLIALLAIGCYSCGTDNDPQPQAPWYFRFQADGVPYEYKYECDNSLFGAGCNMGAGRASSSATFNPYTIIAYSTVDPTARGEVAFILNKDDFNSLDTIVLDGSRNRASVTYFNFKGTVKDYVMVPPLTGKLIFSERTDTTLKGIFEFEAGNADSSILHITDGQFYVKRRN